ncbi:MAG: hypothetical protein ABJF10_13960 [Chthoniobacter sp.]|uniref:hypothetical protein n=1 Tax=Chthoniobacter sp. TaxID=2510640 RepID=UPI0032A68EDC
MTKRTVVVDTDRQRGQLYYVNEYAGRFYIYDVDVGLIFDDKKKIGESRSLADALEIIKSHVGGSVRDVRIK